MLFFTQGLENIETFPLFNEGTKIQEDHNFCPRNYSNSELNFLIFNSHDYLNPDFCQCREY